MNHLSILYHFFSHENSHDKTLYSGSLASKCSPWYCIFFNLHKTLFWQNIMLYFSNESTLFNNISMSLNRKATNVDTILFELVICTPGDVHFLQDRWTAKCCTTSYAKWFEKASVISHFFSNKESAWLYMFTPLKHLKIAMNGETLTFIPRFGVDEENFCLPNIF